MLQDSREPHKESWSSQSLYPGSQGDCGGSGTGLFPLQLLEHGESERKQGIVGREGTMVRHGAHAVIPALKSELKRPKG